jgi:hypothetical protein
VTRIVSGLLGSPRSGHLPLQPTGPAVPRARAGSTSSSWRFDSVYAVRFPHPRVVGGELTTVD